MKSNWIRDLFMIPLVVGVVVGVIVAAFTFGFPFIFSKDRELSYTIEGPIIYLDDPALGYVKVYINDVEVKDLVAYKVRLWNSGDVPLSDLGVRFSFDANQPDFQIFGITHQTIPPEEFGRIDVEKPKPTVRRLVYELLNSNDEDIITFLVNGPAMLSVFSKAEGLSVENVLPDKKPLNQSFITVIAAILSVVGAFVALLFSRFSGSIVHHVEVLPKNRTGG